MRHHRGADHAGGENRSEQEDAGDEHRHAPPDPDESASFARRPKSCHWRGYHEPDPATRSFAHGAARRPAAFGLEQRGGRGPPLPADGFRHRDGGDVAILDGGGHEPGFRVLRGVRVVFGAALAGRAPAKAALGTPVGRDDGAAWSLRERGGSSKARRMISR